MAVSTLNMAPYFTGYPFQGTYFFFLNTNNLFINTIADNYLILLNSIENNFYLNLKIKIHKLMQS